MPRVRGQNAESWRFDSCSDGRLYLTGVRERRYSTGLNEGFRNVTGIVNCDGTATTYAIISTSGGSGDPGADPKVSRH